MKPVRSLLRQAWPLADVGCAALAAAVWYVRPAAGAWPLALIALGWLARRLGSGQLMRPTLLAIPLLLFLASALAAATIGFNQGAAWMDGPAPLWSAWAKFWYIVAGLALFSALASLPRIAHVWRIAQLCALLSVVVALYFVVTNDWTAPGAKFDLLSQVGAALARPFPSLPGRRLNPNVTGGIIAMLMPFFVPVLLAVRDGQAGGQASAVPASDRSRPRGGRLALVVWSALGLAALLGLLLSESRGAWLALVLTAAGWATVRAYSARSHGGRVTVVLLLISFGVLAVVLGVAGRADLGAVSGPAADLSAGGSLPRTSTVLSRLEMLQAGSMLAQDYLFTGAGLGTTPWVLSTYYLLIPVYFTAHVHNMFLDVLIEQGVPGFIPFVLALALAAWLALRALPALHAAAAKQDAHGDLSAAAAVRSRRLLEAALASMCVMALHGLVDDVPYGSRALILLFVAPGIIAATASADLLGTHSARLRHVPPAAVRAAAIGLALLALFAAAERSTLGAALYANLGALAQTQTELAAYHIPDRLPEQLRRSADLTVAIGRLERAVALDPANREANQRLGEIALARAEYDAAHAYLEAAYRQAPDSEVNWQLLGDAYLALGRPDDAFALWSRVPDAPARLELEALLRFEPQNDLERARDARALAVRIRSELTRSP